MKQLLESGNISKPLVRPAHRWRVALVLALISLAFITVAVSFLVLLGLTRIAPDRSVSLTLIVVNLALVFCLVSVIIRELYPIIKSWRSGKTASRLHVRIVSLFSVVATLPALAVAIVAVVTLNLGLDRWFDTNMKQIVYSSINIANGYANETLQTVRNSAYGMALSLDNQRLLSLNPTEYRRQMSMQAAGRDLRGAFLLSPNGAVYLSTDLGNEPNLPIPPQALIAQAQTGRPFLFQPGQHDYFGVILKLSDIQNAFLYVVRDVDRNVLDALRLTEINTNIYGDLEDTRMPMQIAFAVLYLCLFLIMLLSAIWTGVAVADRLVGPIRLLIAAAADVASGNMDVSVPVRRRDGDVGQLAKTFNHMVRELKTQRNELISARDQIDERRRFSEAVLSGVTAGVVGVDSAGDITIVNRSVETMFAVQREKLIGHSLLSLNVEISQVFEMARLSGRIVHKDQITIGHAGHVRVFNVQITMEDKTIEGHSWVVTIDDITNLVQAQRSAAWADVARRIAHEIKNPLTPIQLSAERIHRRYGKVITKDREVFDQCTDTIIRQVGDIGRMVDEFSSFARMPKPDVQKLDIRDPLREACFLIEVSRHDLKLERDFGSQPLVGEFDNRLIAQAFGNVIKNAGEAIDAAFKDMLGMGHILVKVRREEKQLIVDIVDNGKGLPQEQRQKLLEPYMTTREKGTGLGLAIVRKIVEDQGGYMELHDAPQDFYGGRGAMIRIILPALENA